MTSGNKTTERKIKELQDRTKFVKERVGEDTVKVLENMGIDVSSAIGNILEQKIQKQAEAETLLNQPGLAESTSLTSELVYLMKKERDNSRLEKELYRRLDLLRFSPEQKSTFIEDEYGRIQKRMPEISKYGRWVMKYFIIDSVRKEDLPKPEELTLSELILITDDALAARVRDHEWLKDQTMEAVGYIIGDDKTPPPYETELRRRVKEWNWSESAIGSYIRNECLLTEKLKWRYHDNLAWQESTMVKK